jgi:biotin carboxyl carrier protein
VVLRESDKQRSVLVEGEGPYVVSGSHVARDDSEPHVWTLDGTAAAAASHGHSVWVTWRGSSYELRTDPIERDVTQAAAGTEVVAPMPGFVLAVHASAGQAVKRGDAIAVIEAMKMELRIEAPADGTVTRLLCSAGDQLRRGQRIAEFEPA